MPAAAHALLPSSTGLSALRVAAKTPLADGVCGLTLVAPDGGRLPDWTPGAHLDVLLPGDVTRQYSLCGDRWNPTSYRVAVLRELAGRGGSAYVHDTLSIGDLVGVGGPRNNFPLVPAAHYVFVAGGIGITPILPMIQHAELLGTPWTLLYGGRTRSSMAFLPELAAYGDRVRIRPQDEYGLLDLASTLESMPAGAKVYCCGPGPLLDAIEASCSTLAPGTLRTERFVPKEQGPPVRSTPFAVELERSGVTVTVAPGTSVLEAMAAAGVPVLSSCRQGTCGTCETAVLDGVPDHRDSLLTDAERAAGRSMFVCVSRSCGDRLVLDA
ncbi:PDR/VanB family oxidoreductase [Cryptosporangium aurantiacum]|uniref:Ferredoxin-NADP reductase n=1 Tax=Cryptosporangium aurantiacum TaxID=134849 RepID=A0A1M7RAW1_9ACTN|nr:PDR/VanB family oxidoreductase [Cryptosporangium aurantiacum]SHN43269.1 Ferredoxin-NADP reductase [Cryptosporangium aurantiacum]